ncbi:MAG TPA: helix-turn-helix transcriptional regulator [Syntrophorhabdaceae bacterium]|nr:helix-turn-helix transcriptional regulator [Syntrophorhabdaceae bacterium]
MKRFDPQKIKSLRQKLNLTQHEFAHMLGKTYQAQHVHNWETGKLNPSLKSLIHISEAFKLPLEYFFIEDYNHSDNKNRREQTNV